MEDSKEVIKASSDLRCVHGTNTAHPSESNGVIERAVLHVNEGTAAFGSERSTRVKVALYATECDAL